MSDREKLEAALSVVNAAVDRALRVVKGAPYWSRGIDYDDPEGNVFSIELDGENAKLFACEIERGYYDNGDTLEVVCLEFPAALLFMPEAEFLQWKAEARAVYEGQQEEKRKIAAEQKREAELRALAQLKAKYEPN